MRRVSQHHALGCGVRWHQSRQYQYYSAVLDFNGHIFGPVWMIDCSQNGLGLGITITFLAMLIPQLLVYDGVY